MADGQGDEPEQQRDATQDATDHGTTPHDGSDTASDTGANIGSDIASATGGLLKALRGGDHTGVAVVAAVALLVGVITGYSMRNPVNSDEYKQVSVQLATAQSDLQTTSDQLDDEKTHSEELQQDNDTLNGQVTSLTTERDKLNETIKQLTPNVNPGSNPIEIVDIKDMGAQYGYRELEFTVKSNVAAILNSVSVRYQIVDGDGNISRSGSAGAYSIVLNPGKTTVATTFSEDRGYGKDAKIVPVSWSYGVQNGGYTDGDYGEGVKTGTIK